jgi:hypothetical protein
MGDYFSVFCSEISVGTFSAIGQCPFDASYQNGHLCPSLCIPPCLLACLLVYLLFSVPLINVPMMPVTKMDTYAPLFVYHHACLLACLFTFFSAIDQCPYDASYQNGHLCPSLCIPPCLLAGLFIFSVPLINVPTMPVTKMDTYASLFVYHHACLLAYLLTYFLVLWPCKNFGFL